MLNIVSHKTERDSSVNLLDAVEIRRQQMKGFYATFPDRKFMQHFTNKKGSLTNEIRRRCLHLLTPRVIALKQFKPK